MNALYIKRGTNSYSGYDLRHADNQTGNSSKRVEMV